MLLRGSLAAPQPQITHKGTQKMWFDSRTAPHPVQYTRTPCTMQPHDVSHSFISFHFISFHFISFHFISFHFISFHFISFHFISFHFISFHFISFHFIQQCHSARATRARTSDTRDTSQALHHKPPFLKRVAHTRAAFSPFLGTCVPCRFAPPFVTWSSHAARMSSSVSLACGGRDVLFLRALGGLPPPLLTALRKSGLDDAGTLLNYPLDLEDKGGESRQAPSGAASTGHRPLLAMTTCTTPLMEATVSSTRTTVATPASAGGTVDSVMDVGGDPRTDQSVPSGEVKTDQLVPSGGEVKTDQLVSGGDPKTDHFVPSGGEVKTDHIPFSVQMAGVSKEMADSPRSGGWQPKLPFLPLFLLLWTLMSLSRLVQNFAMNCRAIRKIQNFAMNSRVRRWHPIPCILVDSRAHLSFQKIVMDSRVQIIWILRWVSKALDLRLFSTFLKTPNDSASRIQEFKLCPPVAAHPS